MLGNRTGVDAVSDSPESVPLVGGLGREDHAASRERR